jgi:hypothetical protein
LLKEAVLLEAEADQMHFDQVERNKPGTDSLVGGSGEQALVTWVALANL